MAGVVVRFNVAVAGVPAVTDKALEEAGVSVKSVTLIVEFPDVPPPAVVVGFFGFVAETVTLPGVVRSVCGTVIVSDVPVAFGVPPLSTKLPKLTVVEEFSPVPVIVIC